MQFHLGDILTITTGKLVSPDHMDGVYRLLNHMTGDDLMTHQLPRVSRECEADLLRQHPDLAAVTTPERFSGREHVEGWLAEQVERYGERREVRPLAAEDHTRIDPLAEVAMHHPHLTVIRVDEQ